MATGKRFYWMKLKQSFLTSDTIDYFMSQPDGANYVVLYQMLCLMTINTGGRLSRQIGEVIIPYDIEKITRDCKWFSADTVRVALDLYRAFGLIYVDVDGVLVIADHESLVGSETDYARQKKNQRVSGRDFPALPVDSSVDSGVDNVHEDVHTEYRDRDIEIRDKSLEKEIRDRDTGEESPAPPPSEAPVPKSSKSKSQKQGIFETFAGEDANLLAAFQGFEAMRRSIKKPLTDRARQMIVNKLVELAPNDAATQAAILDQSTLHSWQGVFALKDEQRGGVQNGYAGQPRGNSGKYGQLHSDLDD